MTRLDICPQCGEANPNVHENCRHSWHYETETPAEVSPVDQGYVPTALDILLAEDLMQMKRMTFKEQMEQWKKIYPRDRDADEADDPTDTFLDNKLEWCELYRDGRWLSRYNVGGFPCPEGSQFIWQPALNLEQAMEAAKMATTFYKVGVSFGIAAEAAYSFCSIGPGPKSVWKTDKDYRYFRQDADLAVAITGALGDYIRSLRP